MCEGWDVGFCEKKFGVVKLFVMVLLDCSNLEFVFVVIVFIVLLI